MALVIRLSENKRQNKNVYRKNVLFVTIRRYSTVTMLGRRHAPILTYKNKNLNIRLCVNMYKTFPVNVSITGSLWILFWISILIASYSEASGPMLTNGLTSALRTPAGRGECESCLMNLHQNASKTNTHFSTYLIYAPPIHWSSNSLTCNRIAGSWWNPWW